MKSSRDPAFLDFVTSVDQSDAHPTGVSGMSTGPELRRQLVTLSAAARAELAQFLIESLDGEPNADDSEH